MGICECKIRYFPKTFSDYLEKFNGDDRQFIQNQLDQKQDPLTRNLELRLLLYKIIFDFCQTFLDQKNQKCIDDINQWKSNMIQDLLYWKNFSNQENQVWQSFLQNNVLIFIKIFSTEIKIKFVREIANEEKQEAIKIIEILRKNFLYYFDNIIVENFFQSKNIQIDKLIK